LLFPRGSDRWHSPLVDSAFYRNPE
jgi:hypothetical protein